MAAVGAAEEEAMTSVGLEIAVIVKGIIEAGGTATTAKQI